MPTARFLAAAVLLSSCAAFTVGCMVEEKRAGGPRPVPRQPDGVIPDSIVINADLPRDTDGNGYPDATTVSVFVFDSRYPMASLYLPGEFEFTLTAAGGRRLGAWSFNEAQTDAAARPGAPGPMYRFELSLIDQGGDRMAKTEAELAGIFKPIGGAPVRRWVSIHFGRGGPD